MKNKIIYAIRDKAADDLVGNAMYLLFLFNRDEQAIRYFADAMATDKSILALHPEDYQLIRMGELKDSGEIIGYEAPHVRVVIEGASVHAAMQANTPVLINEAANYGG